VLAKVTVVKIVNYGTSVCDYISGDVAAYIGSVLVGVYVALFGSRLNQGMHSWLYNQLCIP
jgi:hypothetical protein